MTDDNDSLLDGLTDDSSRRSFMKKGALTSVGFALGAAGSGSALGQEDGDTDTGTTGDQAGGTQAFMLLNQVVPGAQFTVDSGELDWSPMDGGQGDMATHVVQYDFSASSYAFLFVPSGVDASEGDQFTIDSIQNVTQSPGGGMQDGDTGGLGDGNETDGLGDNDTGLGGDNDTGLGGDNDTGLGGDNDTGLGGDNETTGQMGPTTTPTGQPYFAAVQLSSVGGGAVGDGMADNETEDDGGLFDENETTDNETDIGGNDTNGPAQDESGIGEATGPGEENETGDGGILGGNDTGNNTTDNDSGL